MRQAGELLSKSLVAALQDLALPAEEVLARKPAAKNWPDALALEFDEVYTTFVGSLARLPIEAQLTALQAVDSALHAMGGTENRHLWTDAAFKSDAAWVEVRALARLALEALGVSELSEPGQPSEGRELDELC